jgi:hypothetical protein
MGLPKPHHPLISIVDLKGLRNDTNIDAVVFDLYVISMKKAVMAYITGIEKAKEKLFTTRMSVK